MTDLRVPVIDACAQCPRFLKPERVINSNPMFGPGRYNYGRNAPKRPNPHWCGFNPELEFEWDHKGLHPGCPLPKLVVGDPSGLLEVRV